MIHRGMQLLDICTLVKQSNHSNAFLIEIFGHPGWSYLYTKPNYILVSFYLTYLQSNKRFRYIGYTILMVIALLIMLVCIYLQIIYFIMLPFLRDM